MRYIGSVFSSFSLLIFTSVVYAESYDFKPLTDGQYGFIINQNGQCVSSGPQTNNPEVIGVQLNLCNGGDNQLWTYNEIDRTIRSKNGKCVEILEAENGALLQLGECHGRWNQAWFHQVTVDYVLGVIENGQSRTIRNSGKCIDAQAELYGSENTPLQLWECTKASVRPNRQYWAEPVVPIAKNENADISAGTGNDSEKTISGLSTKLSGQRLVNGTGKCLTVENSSETQTDANNQTVLGVSCSDTDPGQLWRYDDSSKQLISNNNLCLEIDAVQVKKNGGKVQLWPCESGWKNQQWVFESTYINFSRVNHLVNIDGGQCITLDENTQDLASSVIHAWQCEEEKTHTWELE